MFGRGLGRLQCRPVVDSPFFPVPFVPFRIGSSESWRSFGHLAEEEFPGRKDLKAFIPRRAR